MTADVVLNETEFDALVVEKGIPFKYKVKKNVYANIIVYSIPSNFSVVLLPVPMLSQEKLGSCLVCSTTLGCNLEPCLAHEIV